MAQAVKRLLDDSKLAAHLSLNGRKLAEGCTWPKVRPRWEKLVIDATNSQSSLL